MRPQCSAAQYVACVITAQPDLHCLKYTEQPTHNTYAHSKRIEPHIVWLAIHILTTNQVNSHLLSQCHITGHVYMYKQSTMAHKCPGGGWVVH